MKIYLFLLILLIINSLLFSQTTIPAGEVSGTWFQNGSPYLVEGDIIIPDGQTLLIEPGTYVEFQNLFSLDVQGCLNAVGTELDSITFTAISQWHGIQFNNTQASNDSSKIVYSKINHVAPDNTSRGGATISNFDKLLISHCSISENDLEYISGGGISCINSSPIIEFSTIENNSSSIGGGIYCIQNSHPIIRNNLITNNNGGLAGGGIICRNSSSPIIVNNIISENSGGITGGGINCSSNSNPLIVNNLIINNSATFTILPPRGGGIYLDESNATIINNTITSNNSPTGGGLYCIDSNPIITNSIFWDNGQSNVFIETSSNPIVTYCNIQNDYPGLGNIDIDPLFDVTGEYPFSLLDESPCINSATPDTSGLYLPEFDLAGNSRIFGSRIDMGAYENQNVVVKVNDYTISSIFNLSNYPNPFNPSTTIEFSLADNSKIELSIFNIKGQKIRVLANNEFNQGSHSVIWNGDDKFGIPISSGVYLYKLNVNDKTESVKKCLLLK